MYVKDLYAVVSMRRGGGEGTLHPNSFLSANRHLFRSWLEFHGLKHLEVLVCNKNHVDGKTLLMIQVIFKTQPLAEKLIKTINILFNIFFPFYG